MSGSRRRRDEAGSAIIELVWLAVMLLLPLVYVMVAAFEVQRSAYGVSAASRAAARAFVLAPDVDSAYARARTAARVALDDQGVDGGSVEIRCLPTAGDCLRPGSSVRVLVRATRRLPLTPAALGSQLAPVTVDASHVEPFGEYRERR